MGSEGGSTGAPALPPGRTITHRAGGGEGRTRRAVGRGGWGGQMMVPWGRPGTPFCSPSQRHTLCWAGEPVYTQTFPAQLTPLLPPPATITFAFPSLQAASYPLLRCGGPGGAAPARLQRADCAQPCLTLSSMCQYHKPPSWAASFSKLLVYVVSSPMFL